MAVFTQQKAKEVAREAIKRENETGNYTIVVVGNPGFSEVKVRVVTGQMMEVRLTISRMKEEFGENVICLTKESLRNPTLKTHTLTGLTGVLYKRVNNEIDKIIDVQIERIAGDRLGGSKRLLPK